MATYSGNDKKLQYLFGRTQDMTGATSSSYGTAGVVPAPAPGDEGKYLKGDGTWDSVDEVEVAQKLTKTETVVAVDTEPYISRTALTPEGASGYVREKLIGGSIAWNQLVDDTGASGRTSNGVTFTKNGDGSWTLTGTPTGNNVFCNVDYVANQQKYLEGHVYYVPKCTDSTLRIGIRAYGIGEGTDTATTSDARDWIVKNGATATAYPSHHVRIQVSNLTDTDIGTVTVYPQLFDLTLMLGAEVADAIYTMEQAEQGAGVAWFRNLFPEDYYAYTEGTLLPVQTSGKTATKDGHTHEYPLSAVQLYGIPTWADGKLAYDGDEYASSGTVTRKYGIVDLGTQSWRYSSTSDVFYITLTGRKVYAAAQALCARYAYYGTGTSTSLANNLPDKEFGFYRTTATVVIRDSTYGTDADAFATAMSGVYLVYELATETTETADPFTNPQVSEGTEAFIDTRTPAVPVGHYTEYMGATEGEYAVVPTMPVDEGKFVLTTDGQEVLWERQEEPQEVYSTEEQAIGTWIDGKTLYKRTWVIDWSEGQAQPSDPTRYVFDIYTGDGYYPKDYVETIVESDCMGFYTDGSIGVRNWYPACSPWFYNDIIYPSVYSSANPRPIIRIGIHLAESQPFGAPQKLYISIKYTKLTT